MGVPAGWGEARVDDGYAHLKQTQNGAPGSDENLIYIFMRNKKEPFCYVGNFHKKFSFLFLVTLMVRRQRHRIIGAPEWEGPYRYDRLKLMCLAA